MKSIQIDKALNIHARPAALLARLASGYKSMIFFSAGDKFADAKNVMDIMDFFSGNPTSFELCVDGSDELTAIDQMQELIMTFE